MAFNFEQEDFVLSLSITSPVLFTIPHEGLRAHEIGTYFRPRPHGICGTERYLSAIANDVNTPRVLTSVVRGLLPRALCDYNRPLTGVSDPAYADERLGKAYDAYHRKIRHHIQRLSASYKEVILVDLHGFNEERSGIHEDVVLGVHDSPLSLALAEKCALALSVRGFSVRIAKGSEKFSGGFTVRRYAARGVAANLTTTLQIEISSRFRQDTSLQEGRHLANTLRFFVQALL